MTDFGYKLEHIQTDALSLDYFLVSWDTRIVTLPVAEIRRLEVRNPAEASLDYTVFKRWCETSNITLCSCRIPSSRLIESMFLETHEFRFIELNYRPRLVKLQGIELPSETHMIEPARRQDRDLLAEMASKIFQHGRFHQDPRLGEKLGNRRYRMWLLNSFEQAHQRVFKCSQNGEIVAFFVVEYPEQGHCFWSLVGMAPGFQGRGIGKRVWRSMLRWHQAEGIDTVTTSISSHNFAAFNLYVSLGFRFPAPHTTFHWRPQGAILFS